MEQALIELAADDTETRLRGVRRLTVTGDDPAVACLIRLIDDPEEAIAGPAAFSLGQLEAAAALPVLLDRLQTHPSGEVRSSCALALENFGPEVAVHALVAALNDPDESVIYTAAYTLGELGDPVAIEGLRRLLAHPRWNLRYVASKALIELNADPPELTPALRELLRAPEQCGTFHSLDWIEAALARHRPRGGSDGTEGSAPSETEIASRAARVLRQGDADQRKQAAWELYRLPNLTEASPAAQALTQALDDPEVAVRSTAALTLLHHGVGAALPALVRLTLHDESEHIRRVCGSLLHHFPTAEVVEPLCQALRDADWGVRLGAVTSLRHLGDRRAVPHLLPLLHDPHWNTRASTCWALVSLGAPDARVTEALEQLAQEPGAIDWDLEADEINRMLPPESDPESGEEECRPVPRIRELLAAARRGPAARAGETHPAEEC